MHYSELIVTDMRSKPVGVSNGNGAILDALVKSIKDIASKTDFKYNNSNQSNKLSVEQINELAGYMLYLEETYFSDTKYLHLSGKLFKGLLENIPEHIFDEYIDARYNMQVPDIMNPMFYFYIFWVNEPCNGTFEFVDIINKLYKEEFSNE